MPAAAPPPVSSGFDLGDIYYALFRHKWKILSCFLAGLLAAALYLWIKPPPYQSVAKLVVLYVVNGERPVGLTTDLNNTKSPDMRGETIMESEQEILTSQDLARQVAVAIGPAKILARTTGGRDLSAAAKVVAEGLTIDVPARSSVIQIVFRHPDPAIVQPALRELVDQYQKMHQAVHQPARYVGDFLTAERDQYRQQLAQTEKDLLDIRTKAGVGGSVQDAQKQLADELGRIREQTLTAEAELAEKATVLAQLSKAAPAAEQKPSDPDAPAVSSAKVSEYVSAIGNVERFRKAEQELLVTLTPENSRVKVVHAQRLEAEAAQAKLEADNPGLLKTPAAATNGTPSPSSTNAPDLALQAANLAGLQDKIKILSSQYEGIKTLAAQLDQYDLTIAELSRRKDREEVSYKYYSDQVEQNQVNEALTGGKMQNINEIQTPTPAYIDLKQTAKTIGMIIAAGLALGLAWAFAIELYFDRSIRRPKDIENLLQIPLFLSVPAMSHKKARREKTRNVTPQTAAIDHPLANSTIVPWDKQNALHPFHETLRDRLIGYFESRNLTHKPKLVAVTGLGGNAGVSTTAAGIASCLSETGEGNVLLVDLTPGQSSSQEFYRGKPVCGIEEILSERDSAQVQAKLYVVSDGGSGEKLSRALPQRFSKLIPKLKASDFDYIIFDMPPVSQISITPRVAGFMDMVLLVIESEKNNRDLVQRAVSLLAESKAHVGAVLNKTRTYVPPGLHQEYLGNA